MTVQLSLPALKVLREFVVEPERGLTGYQLSKISGVHHGIIYPILHRLRDEGWLSVIGQGSSTSRRLRHIYRATDIGLNEARDVLRQVQVPQLLGSS